jgi:hypothetical protein
MALYLTKVWGFSVPCGPLQFSTAGWRDRARAELRQGDLVVLVGTREEPTPEEDRGRLLGMMEPTTEPVMSLDFPLTVSDTDFTESGEYKWPYGLLNRQAWRFVEPPLLEEVSQRRFTMDSALGIVPLTDEESTRVLDLRRESVALSSSIRVLARIEGEDVARRRGAPVPTTTRAGIMHIRRAPAYTYAMAIEGASNAFKIGWALDYKARMQQFNLSSLPELGGLRYRVRMKELWNTAQHAFHMEQYLLRSFDSFRHRGNREVICPVRFEELQRVWTDYLQRSRSQNS